MVAQERVRHGGSMTHHAAPALSSSGTRRTLIGAGVVFAVFLLGGVVAWGWWQDAEGSNSSTSAIGTLFAEVLMVWVTVPALVTALAVGIHRIAPKAAWVMVLLSLSWLGGWTLLAALIFLPI